MKQIISTKQAPDAIGAYSQAVKVNDTVYLSGQIPLVPSTMTLVTGDIKNQVQQVFDNLQAVCQAAGGDLHHIVKLTVYLLDLNNFAIVNEVMADYFQQPYPARVALGAAALPKDADVEIDAIMVVE